MLKNKVALVTGGGSGIGRAIALAWAREGAQVVVSDITALAGEETVALVRAQGGDALFVAADVGKADRVSLPAIALVADCTALTCIGNDYGYDEIFRRQVEGLGKAGDVLMVEFSVCGIPCIGLNGGPKFPHSEAFSFQIATDDQEETDRYWNAIVGNGGAESECGWCKDKWGINWQITPRVLIDAMAQGGDVARRAFGAMMTMQKLDVAAIEAAVKG